MTGDETVRTGDWPPLILAVAPNGARKTHADHPKLPMTPAEIAETAVDCLAAGAAMIHLHVRDAAGAHSLDPDLYRQAIDALRDAVGDRLIIQVTSEAVGRYTAAEQIDMVRRLRPEAVSLAPRELLPEGAPEEPVAEFLAWLSGEGILPQFILYDAEDVVRFSDLTARGVVPPGAHSVLYVLGRYSKGQRSDPGDLLPFLGAQEAPVLWSLCAFGPREAACALTAAALGGHARIGFENNMLLPDGSVAPDNAASLAVVADAARAIGRPLATAQEARQLFADKAGG